MSPEEEKGELDLEIAGQKVRTKGYRLMDLLWLVVGAASIYSVFLLQTHAADVDRVVKENRESSSTVASALKESNQEMARVLKENNAATIHALKELTSEQKKSTDAMKETACLLDPMMRNRSDAREFCKRVTGGGR